jgi:hypothetical protein
VHDGGLENNFRTSYALHHAIASLQRQAQKLSVQSIPLFSFSDLLPVHICICDCLLFVSTVFSDGA